MFGIFLNLLHFSLWIVATGPGAFFGMVGCLDLVALVIRTPGLPLFGDLASFHPVDFASCWTSEMSGYPNIWMLVLVFICLLQELAYEGSVWGTAEEYGDARLERRRAFLPVPGVLQTVQRAEFWGAILALQAYWPCNLGIDNLNVARSIGRLLDHDSLVKPLPLVKDGDLIALARCMIRTRGRETVRVTKQGSQACYSG